MFIAMNRFKVNPERSADFEAAWRDRRSYLKEVPGFVRFALLRGDVPGEFISHSTWESRDAFKAWTQSEAFHKAHGQGMGGDILEGPPQVSLYEAVIVEPA